MKIVLDLQGAQSHSRHRGIGRYTLSMAKAFAVEAAAHDLWLVLNGREDASSEYLIGQFKDLVPRRQMVIDEVPADVAGCIPRNRPRARAAEIAQAGLFARLDADCVWHSSMFEGWADDSVAALSAGGRDHRHAATLYDLIPLRHPDRHLQHAAYRQWYYRRLSLLKRCGLLLALSESTRRDAIECLQIREDTISVVHGAADFIFQPMHADAARKARWKRDWGLDGDFVLYVGGYDRHKNVGTLIAAYAALAPSLRLRVSLLLAGRCDAQTKKRLELLVRQQRLDRHAVMFTGSLDDEDLVALYSTCTLFVTPSLYEGLGLPALEAMSCGAAVIGSDTSSLPEVIGRSDALFDPRSRSDMAARMQAVLVDPDFRDALRRHGPQQARTFTWQGSARKALAAIEQRMRPSVPVTVTSARPRLLYVSPLPPERSGIADYSAGLLRELGNYYDIEVVVDQAEVLDPWIEANYPIRTLSWFAQYAQPDMRVLYHFGNSPFHAHMFGMLERVPGVVVLHDAWLSALRNWMAQQANQPDAFLRQLYADHCYGALDDDAHQERRTTLDAYPMSLEVIDRALGLIVHSSHAVETLHRAYGYSVEDKFHVVPFARSLASADRRASRRFLGLAPDDFVVCCFGMLAPTKLNHRVLEAWLRSRLGPDARCRLLFVGENEGGAYGRSLQRSIQDQPDADRVRITGHVSRQTYDDYLASADLAVQLRGSSRGETSAAVFDVLAHGLPLIVNAHGSATELADVAVFKLADAFDTADLVHALEQLRADSARRAALGARGRELLAERHRPARVAREYRNIIEQLFAQSGPGQVQALRARSHHRYGDPSGSGSVMMRANRQRIGKACLYVDVTATSESVLRTGIERVVHGVLRQLLTSQRSAFRVEPVCLRDGGFVHAREFALRVLGHHDIGLDDTPVQPHAGDIFLGLDWVADALPADADLLRAWRIRGVRMFFVVYDLLPVRLPHHFPDGIADMHAHWLQCIGAHADGLVCISRSVADDVRDWYRDHPPERGEDLPIGYFHPGNDPDAAIPSTGMPDDADAVLTLLRRQPSFLMLGTMEPRKGHALVLDAFEQLWANGNRAVLVIVGRSGWMSDTFIQRMRAHAQWGQQLLWLEQVSDEYLQHVLTAVNALIAASEGEGFGLPLVEAARRGLPVIARDIAVFREVASEFAEFFDGARVESLTALLEHHATADGGMHSRAPRSAGVSWGETTVILGDLLLDDKHPQWLAPWRVSPASDGA